MEHVLRKASGVLFQGTESGAAPDHGVNNSNGLLFYGTYPEKNGSVIWSDLTGKIPIKTVM